MATNPLIPPTETSREGFNPQEIDQHCATCAYCTDRIRTENYTHYTTVIHTCALSGRRIHPQYFKCSLYRRRTP